MDNKNNCCGCGSGGCGGESHNHEHEGGCCEGQDDFGTITLTLEDGTETECSIIGTFDINEQEYICLLPHDEDEITIFKYKVGEDDSLEIEPIESDEEYELATSRMLDLFDDDVEIVDGDAEGGCDCDCDGK